MRFASLLTLLLTGAASAWPQAGEIKTAAAVLEKYQQALGGVDVIKKVQSETRHGFVESTGMRGQATILIYAKPFKSFQEATLPGNIKITSGFDGTTSWTITPKGAIIDKDTPVAAVRRDADLQYALHQPDYFQSLNFAGITVFEGRRCYWLYGTTNWGKENNQYYDVETGLLAGYRFQSDSSATATTTTALFEDYKGFGGPLVATKLIATMGDQKQTVTITSVTYEPLADSLFELPPAVQALIK